MSPFSHVYIFFAGEFVRNDGDDVIMARWDSISPQLATSVKS